MEKETGSDLKIYGMGNASGGAYRNVVIYGKGKIEGNLDCESFQSEGVFHGAGDIKSKRARIDGLAVFQGGMEATEVKVEGSIEIAGDLAVEEIKAHGMINVKGDCKAETFDLVGAFTIEGLLNTGKLELDLYGQSRVREIGGEKITVKKEGIFKITQLTNLIKSMGLVNVLVAETIEGDDLELEYTQAKVVRGNNIILGPGCDIDLVEYKETLQQSDDARVKEKRKI